MSKEIEDIIGNGFEFDIHFYGNSGRRALIEYIKETAKQESIGFAEWMGEEVNPFVQLAVEPVRWVQACGNSTSWTTAELYEKYHQQQKEGK